MCFLRAAFCDLRTCMGRLFNGSAHGVARSCDAHFGAATVVLLTAALLVCLSACGGGTTGTSPTGELKFSGVAEKADGARAGMLNMTVRSGSSDEALADSGTNSQGEFLMQLPASEEMFVIEVAGVGSTSIARMQRGEGSMSAKLAAMKDGTLVAAQLSESQIDSSTLCESLAVEEGGLRVDGALGQGACLVDIVVESQELAVASFYGTVLAKCNGARDLIQQSRADATGRVRFDLSSALSSGCQQLELVVASSQAPELSGVFVVK